MSTLTTVLIAYEMLSTRSRVLFLQETSATFEAEASCGIPDTKTSLILDQRLILLLNTLFVLLRLISRPLD